MRHRNLLVSLVVFASVATASAAVTAVGAQGELSVPATAISPAQRIAPPRDLTPDRPRVFMAFHGMNSVANNPGLDSRWRYVQQNLDGLWGNNAAISGDEIARLINKVETRQLIAEVPMPSAGQSLLVPSYRYVERIDPRIDFEREAVAFYTNQPSSWNGHSISEARRAVDQTDFDGEDQYIAVHTGWQPQNFDPASAIAIRSGTDADRAVNESDGMFIECPNDVCNGFAYEDWFFAGLRRARQVDRPFIWFASRPPNSPTSGWLREFQTMYNRIDREGLWRPGDVVVVIAYNGQYPIVPESVNGQPADTTMGLMYWALQQ